MRAHLAFDLKAGEAAGPRALFLYSPVGGGHLGASRALGDAWRATHPEWQCAWLDYLQFMPQWEKRLWLGLYHFSLRYWPALWRNYRRWTDRPSEPRFIRDRVSRAGTNAFAELLTETRPKLVVNFSGGSAALAGAARERLGISFVNAIVVTGFRAHHHWARPEADLLFVACDAAKADLIERGVAPERVKVLGTPIRKAARPLSVEERSKLRAALGLGDDPVLMISSGATGAYRALPSLLRTLERLDRPLDLITCERGAFERIETRGAIRHFHLGFRNDYCSWLSASDLVVGKIGGMTGAEALAAGVPLVIYEPIPGQEEANADELVASGAAIWPRSARGLAHAIDELLGSTEKRTRMSRAALRFSRPDAAAKIAEQLDRALEVLS
jgi:processive 1,2-diacylglycerol beta-glucosyltransferase